MKRGENMKPAEVIRTLKRLAPNPYDFLARKAVEEAIKALEKQVTKKPTRFGSKHIYICPNCARAEYIKRRDALDTHCGFCGQAIDWEEEE